MGAPVRRWSPWAELRARPHLRLRWAVLPDDVGGGRIEDRPTGRTVVIDPRLGRRDRAAVLAHELIHDERDILYPPGCPAALVAKEEAAVDRAVARRLVPLDALRRLVAARSAFGPVTTAEIADEFDVPVEVAQRAAELVHGR